MTHRILRVLSCMFIVSSSLLVGVSAAADFASSTGRITAIRVWSTKESNRYGTRIYLSKMPAGCNYFYVADRSGADRQVSIAIAAQLSGQQVSIQKHRDAFDVTVDKGCMMNLITLAD